MAAPRRADLPAQAFSLTTASRSGISSVFSLLRAQPCFPHAPPQAPPQRRPAAVLHRRGLDATPPPSTTGAVSVPAVHSSLAPLQVACFLGLAPIANIMELRSGEAAIAEAPRLSVILFRLPVSVQLAQINGMG
jgi:hypothetical protein